MGNNGINNENVKDEKDMNNKELNNKKFKEEEELLNNEELFGIKTFGQIEDIWRILKHIYKLYLIN